MKRITARILKKDGTVMFAVLSVMSALIALAVGLLFIVNAERQTLIEQVGEEQVYQMTVSANDFVFDYLNLFFNTTPEGEDIAGKDDFLDGVMALDEGDLMTFDKVYLSRDLEKIDPAAAANAIYMYETKVKMEDIDDTSTPNTTLNTIDISTDGWYKNADGVWSKDAKNVTRRMVVRTYSEPPPPPATDMERFFAVGFGALGGPQKSTITGPKLDHSIYFGHNEVTLSEIKDIKHLGFFGKLISGRNMKFAQNSHIQLSVRNAFVVNSAATRFFDSQSKGSTVRIGDYLYSMKPLDNNLTKPRPLYLYVLGREPYDNRKLNDGNINVSATDLNKYLKKSVVEAEFFIDDKEINNNGDRASKQIFINGDLLVNNSTEGTFFINGDMYIMNANAKGTFYVSGDVIFGANSESKAKDGIYYIGGKARFGNTATKFKSGEVPTLRTADDSADIIMSSGGGWSSSGEGVSDDPSKFPWGTYEAWPVFRDDPSNPDLDLSLFPIAAPADGWGTEIPITDFETVEECFDRLNYETVAVSYTSTGMPELSDPALSPSGRRNYILLSKPYNGTNLALQSDPDAEPRKVVISVKPGSGDPTKGNLCMDEEKDSETPDYVATMEYHFLEGGVITKADEHKILSPKVYPIWDPKEILAGLGKTDDLIQMGLEPPTGDMGENKIDLSTLDASTLELDVTSSGYISGIVPNTVGAGVRTIYIDTTRSTDTPEDDGDIYIRLPANVSGNKFEWMQNANTNVAVIVKGAGSVVFFVDDGVIYNSGSGNTFIGHEGWYDLVLGDGTLSYSSPSLAYKTAIDPYIHEATLCNRTGCLYCEDETGTVGVTKSPGAHLIRQDRDPDDKGKLIDKNIDNKRYIHNNIFIVNQNNYGATTNFPDGDYYTQANNYFNKTQIFGLIYSNFSKVQTKGTTSYIAGAAIGSEYVLDGSSSTLEMSHIMLAFYYDRLERAGSYHHTSNRYLYNRNVMPALLRKTPDDADATTEPGKTIYTFITEGFR